MHNFIFQHATDIYFGKGCVKEYLFSLCASYHTVMLAYGSGAIRRCGIYGEVRDILRASGKRVVEYPGLAPAYPKVLEGAAIAQENNVDLILAVGGGAVIDGAKAISLSARCKGDDWNEYWARPGVIDFEPLPLGVILTCAGAGSECNGTAVIANAKEKRSSRDYPQLNPRFALMDPTYTYSVPKPLMASGSFSALAHIMLAYFSVSETDSVANDLMEALMKSIIRNLRVAMRDPQDYTARSNLMWASALSAVLGKQKDERCVRLTYQLEAIAGCGHGSAMAVLCPAYLRCISADATARFARCAEKLWGVERKGRSEADMAELAIKALEDFIREIGLPAQLRQLQTDVSSLMAAAPRMPAGFWQALE